MYMYAYIHMEIYKGREKIHMYVCMYTSKTLHAAA